MEKPKYKIVNSSLPLDLLAIEASSDEFAKFVEDYLMWSLKRLAINASRQDAVIVNERLIAYAEKSECFMEFLLNGYIELVESEYDKWLKEVERYCVGRSSNATEIVSLAKRMPRE